MSKSVLNLTLMTDSNYPKSFVGYIDTAFRHLYKNEWFVSEYARRVIKGIDGGELVQPMVVINKYGNGVSPTVISRTAKCLLLMYFHPEYYYLNSMFDDNAWGFICDMVDEGITLNIGIDCEFHPNDDLPRKIPLKVNGEVIDDYWQYENILMLHKDSMENQVVNLKSSSSKLCIVLHDSLSGKEMSIHFHSNKIIIVQADKLSGTSLYDCLIEITDSPWITMACSDGNIIYPCDKYGLAVADTVESAINVFDDDTLLLCKTEIEECPNPTVYILRTAHCLMNTDIRDIYTCYYDRDGFILESMCRVLPCRLPTGKYDAIVTERDDNEYAHTLMEDLFRLNHVVYSGKSKLYSILRSLRDKGCKRVLLVFDACTLGSEIKTLNVYSEAMDLILYDCPFLQELFRLSKLVQSSSCDINSYTAINQLCIHSKSILLDTLLNKYGIGLLSWYLTNYTDFLHTYSSLVKDSNVLPEQQTYDILMSIAPSYLGDLFPKCFPEDI